MRLAVGKLLDIADWRPKPGRLFCGGFLVLGKYSKLPETHKDLSDG
jgi:hypothetical protein